MATEAEMQTEMAPGVSGLVMMTAEEARACVERVKGGIEQMRRDLLELREREGWKALGYSSWRACAVAEFGVSLATVYRQLKAATIERDLSQVENRDLSQVEKNEGPIESDVSQVEKSVEPIPTAQFAGAVWEQDFSQVEKNAGPISQVEKSVGPIPTAQLQPLKDLDPDERRAAWKHANELAGSGQRTAAHVEQAVAVLKGATSGPFWQAMSGPIRPPTSGLRPVCRRSVRPAG